MCAQGKLPPVAAETEAAVEDATAQAFEQSPENRLIEIEQIISARSPTHRLYRVAR